MTEKLLDKLFGCLDDLSYDSKSRSIACEGFDAIRAIREEIKLLQDSLDKALAKVTS